MNILQFYAFIIIVFLYFYVFVVLRFHLTYLPLSACRCGYPPTVRMQPTPVLQLSKAKWERWEMACLAVVYAVYKKDKDKENAQQVCKV